MIHTKIIPKNLNGNINIPPSKSLSHRAIICGSLSKGISNIENIILSKDIEATIKGMEVLGCKINDLKENKNVKILKIKGEDKNIIGEKEIDCFESGSTLRFLIPISLINNKKIIFKGRGKLVSRPLDVYYDIFEKQQIKYKSNNKNLPLEIEGNIKPGEFYVKGDISSQFITGLMFTLPLLNEDSKIIITTELESKGYIDLTIDCLKKFGIIIENNNYKEFSIKGNQKYLNRDYKVEGDFSQAAFWIVAGIIGNNIKMFDLNINSLQGDMEIINIIKKMGGELRINEKFIEAKESETKGIIIDASECPDLVPVVSVLASLSDGTTKIINGKRLRIKECDRLKAMATELFKIGADIKEIDDGLIIKGKPYLNGGIVESWNDHRIAMAMAIASIRCIKPLIIKNSNVVNKSYPHFWDDFKKLGGEIHEWSMGEQN